MASRFSNTVKQPLSNSRFALQMKKWLQAKGFTSSPKALAFRLTVRTYIRIVAKDFVGDNAEKTKKTSA